MVAQPGPAGCQDRQAWDEDTDRSASAYLVEACGTDSHGVTHLSGEPCGQRHQQQGPRIVTERGQVGQPSDLREPGHARLEVARQQERCAAGEAGHQLLLGVVGIGGSVDPATAVGQPGDVIEPEPRERELGEVTDQRGSLEQVGRLVEVLHGLRHGTGVLLQHPEREQSLAAGPVRHPFGQHPVDQATDPGDVAGLERVVGGQGESLPARSGSGVSSEARSSAVAAAAKARPARGCSLRMPPTGLRAWGSWPAADSARCQIRFLSLTGNATASEAWASRRSPGVASSSTLLRSSGCRIW